jgi:type II secretory pathway component PulF
VPKNQNEYFLENLNLLVSSGLSIHKALDSIRSEVRSKKMQGVISRIKDEIEDGSSLSNALERTKMYPEHVISLIRVGEESGRLVENLKVVGDQQEKERVFRSKIRSAMLYPIFVFSLTVIVGTGISWFILPKLALVFAQLHIKLPVLTRGLIAFGNFLGEWGYLVVPTFLIVGFLIVYFVFFFSKTRWVGQEILYFTPGVKRLAREVELSRFGYLFGTLLQAGIPIVRSLAALENTTTLVRYRKLYRHLKERIDEGESFQKSFLSFNKSNFFIPIPIQQLIVAGEQSGGLQEALLKIHKNFEAKIDTTTKDLTVVFEPILLVIVWLGVVAVALAVILPIYSLVGEFQTQ